MKRPVQRKNRTCEFNRLQLGTFSAACKSAADDAKEKADAVALKVVAMSNKADHIDARLDATQYVLSARRVQDENGLADDLTKYFKGSHIAFRSYIGDEEAFWLCDQLMRIADRAGVGPKYECGREPLSSFPIADLLIKGPSHKEEMRLGQILKKPGRVPGIFVSLSEAPTLTVFVGVKRSFLLLPKTEERPKRQASSKPRDKP